jgi:hypothetical protein
MFVLPAKKKTKAKTKTAITPRRVPVFLSILICIALYYASFHLLAGTALIHRNANKSFLNMFSAAVPGWFQTG